MRTATAVIDPRRENGPGDRHVLTHLPGEPVMTTLTHRVTLHDRSGKSSTHDISDAEAGLRALAAAAAARITGADVVIFDRSRHASQTLHDLGWRAAYVQPTECPHQRLRFHSDFEAMDYRATCVDCEASWSWEDLHIPDEVMSQAKPVWEDGGL